MKEIAIVFFNQGMFAATGESDKPVLVIKLTEEQQKEIDKYKMEVLSIHPIIQKP